MDYFEPERDFPSELTALSWADLRRMADYHSRMASTCLERARRLRNIEEMKTRARERVDALEASYKLVLGFLDQGYNSLESAIAAASRESGFPEMAILGWWKVFVRKRDGAARQERDQRILNLVNAGFTNEEIAARMGVSKNTVSRAISARLFPGLRPCDRARLRKRRRAPSPSPG